MLDHHARLRTILANKAKGGFRVAAKDEQTKAEIYLYEEIDATDFCGVSARTFVKQLNDIDADEITLYINSPGGDAFEGIAIMNALRRHKAKVTTVVDGLAASAASFIAMAGDEVVMSLGSELMVHDAWGLCVGNADDMSEVAGRLAKLSADLAGIYAEHAGGTADQWRDAMRAETWYTAEEAVEAGLATRVETARGNEPAEQAKARFDLSVFAHAGRAAARAPFIPAARAALKPPSVEPMASTTPNTDQEVTVADTDTLRAALAQRLGVTDANPSDETLLAAYDEAAAEAAEPATPAATLPEGVVTIDETVLETLRASAARADALAERQTREDRESIVDNAIRATHTTPAMRDKWLTSSMPNDELKTFLNSLATGAWPGGDPIGHSDGIEASVTDAEFATWERAFDLPEGSLR